MSGIYMSVIQQACTQTPRYVHVVHSKCSSESCKWFAPVLCKVHVILNPAVQFCATTDARLSL